MTDGVAAGAAAAHPPGPASDVGQVRLIDPAVPETEPRPDSEPAPTDEADPITSAADPADAPQDDPPPDAQESADPDDGPAVVDPAAVEPGSGDTGSGGADAIGAPVEKPSAPPFPVTDADTGGADTFGFGFNLAKIADHGEDADPVLHRARDLGIVGVFDGMGGAGGTVYETADGPRTGAYLASRVVRDVVERELLETVGRGGDLDGPATAEQLHRVVTSALADALAALHAPRSGLRSKLIRALPTTMAVAVVQRRDRDGQVWDCDLFWAGDSRVYVVDPAAGAAQLTPDDIRDRSDAMANLRADSVLSNAISADTPFVVHHRRLDLTVPFLLVAATDGAFGYLPSPMHFEHMVLSTLRSTADVDGWSTALQARISEVTGDDAAMSVLGLGADRETLREQFGDRTHLLENEYVRPLDGLSIDLQRLELEVEILRNRSAEVSADLWAAYKPVYERHLDETTATAGS